MIIGSRCIGCVLNMCQLWCDWWLKLGGVCWQFVLPSLCDAEENPLGDWR
jgi:hypothetical protein